MSFAPLKATVTLGPDASVESADLQARREAAVAAAAHKADLVAQAQAKEAAQKAAGFDGLYRVEATFLHSPSATTAAAAPGVPFGACGY